MADPGHATALSLLQVSSALMNVNPTADNVVAVYSMRNLVDEIGDEMIKAHRKLERDERLQPKKRAPAGGPASRRQRRGPGSSAVARPAKRAPGKGK